MQEAQKGEDLIDRIVARSGCQSSESAVVALAASLQFRCNVIVLNCLQELHGKEEENTTGQLNVGSSGVDPPSREQTNSRKGGGHFTREAHIANKRNNNNKQK